MNHFVLSAAIGFLCSLTVVVMAWRSPYTGRLRFPLSAYWASIAFWAFFVGTQPLSIRLLTPFWWGWFLHLGCIFIPVLLFHFTLVFTGQHSPAHLKWLTLAYTIAVVFNLLNLTTKVFTDGTSYRDAYAYPAPSWLYPAYFLFFVVLVSWATWLMIKSLAAVTGREVVALRLLLCTHILSYIGGMDNFLIMADIRLPLLYPYGLYLIPSYAAATVYALRCSKLLHGVRVVRQTAGSLDVATQLS